MGNTSSDSYKHNGFDELYTKYRKYFVEVAMSYTRNRMVAEDIVTDCFMAYWENNQTREINSAPAYILRSIKNSCLNWMESFRQHAKAHDEIYSTAYRLNEMNINSYRANEPQSLFWAEANSIIRRELEKMPEKTRKVFIAHRYEDMSYKEIAKLYGLTEGQIQ